MMEATLTLIEKTAFLKGVDVLASIPTEALAELAGRSREIHCEPGHVLYREGDPHRGVFLVVDGLLEHRRGRAIVRVLRSGMAAGEFWMSPDEPHQYTLIAIEHSHVLHVSLEDMLDAMLDFPEFGVAMSQAMGRRVHELIGRVLELESLVARLHSALLAAGIEPPDPRQAEASDGASAHEDDGERRSRSGA
jgi:CRP-like cAMP-binding protein